MTVFDHSGLDSTTLLLTKGLQRCLGNLARHNVLHQLYAHNAAQNRVTHGVAVARRAAAAAVAAPAVSYGALRSILPKARYFSTAVRARL